MQNVINKTNKVYILYTLKLLNKLCKKQSENSTKHQFSVKVSCKAEKIVHSPTGWFITKDNFPHNIHTDIPIHQSMYVFFIFFLFYLTCNRAKVKYTHKKSYLTDSEQFF